MALFNKADTAVYICYVKDSKLCGGELVDVGETHFFSLERLLGSTYNCYMKIEDTHGTVLQYLSYPRQTSGGYMVVKMDGRRVVKRMPIEHVMSGGMEMEREERWEEAIRWYRLSNEATAAWRVVWLLENKLGESDDAMIRAVGGEDSKTERSMQVGHLKELFYGRQSKSQVAELYSWSRAPAHSRKAN
eukprot:TRINITY_DN646_c0_g1_i4.p1 TRINITY_DN646_c0_g1~~TRINITY_DN646_c0_g1_i4.p1  ORF type:complete len:189 (-),score=29.97 TRINITY_DN646_c0_g1_i4:255-821(-)